MPLCYSGCEALAVNEGNGGNLLESEVCRNTAANCTSRRASFSLSKPPFSDARRKAESDLNAECLISTGVVAVHEKARAWRM